MRPAARSAVRPAIRTSSSVRAAHQASRSAASAGHQSRSQKISTDSGASAGQIDEDCPNSPQAEPVRAHGPRQTEPQGVIGHQQIGPAWDLGQNPTPPGPDPADARETSRLARLIHRVLVEEHLGLVLPAVPVAGLRAGQPGRHPGAGR